MVDRRAPERTKAALLDAALVEFSAKGRAGARTSEIAARAGVNKQLISHHFGGKDGLYRALVDRWLADEAERRALSDPLADIAVLYIEDGVKHRDLHRLLLRASLEDDEHGGGVDANDLEDIRRRQDAGEITHVLDPAFVLLAVQAIAAAGIVFPGDVRRLTGKEPRSRAFLAWYADQVRTLIRLIGGDAPR